MARTVADILNSLVGPKPPVRIQLWDGSGFGPQSATQVVVRTPEAMRRVLFRPDELGFARAYVAGEIDVEGDIFDALELRHHLGSARPTRAVLRGAAALLRQFGPLPPPPPADEARLRGRRHSRQRDADAIAHHYDLSNAFYRLVLGASMTYSCALWGASGPGAEPDTAPSGPEADAVLGAAASNTTPLDTTPLDAAQEAKHELVCRKLGLRPGMRMLDVGCGWGSLLLHAARHHGVEGVGVTVSREQADLARRRIADTGLADRLEIRLQDYRDVADGPFDAISSVGMVEHVGAAMLPVYFRNLFNLLRPAGRLLNHGIAFPGDPAGQARNRPRLGPLPLPAGRDFVARYVFPDGELHEAGAIVSVMQAAGFELRHVENLREHYALTLRAWVRNLEERWEAAVAEAGEGRARVWLLYMAGSALMFEAGQAQIHQVLAVRRAGGRAGMPLRPLFDSQPYNSPLHDSQLYDSPLSDTPSQRPSLRSRPARPAPDG